MHAQMKENVVTTDEVASEEPSFHVPVRATPAEIEVTRLAAVEIKKRKEAEVIYLWPLNLTCILGLNYDVAESARGSH
jgi:hypothetical protein